LIDHKLTNTQLNTADNTRSRMFLTTEFTASK